MAGFVTMPYAVSSHSSTSRVDGSHSLRIATLSGQTRLSWYQAPPERPAHRSISEVDGFRIEVNLFDFGGGSHHGEWVPEKIGVQLP